MCLESSLDLKKFAYDVKSRGHSAKISFYSGILYAKFFDCGVSQKRASNPSSTQAYVTSHRGERTRGVCKKFEVGALKIVFSVFVKL